MNVNLPLVWWKSEKPLTDVNEGLNIAYEILIFGEGGESPF